MLLKKKSFFKNIFATSLLCEMKIQMLARVPGPPPRLVHIACSGNSLIHSYTIFNQPNQQIGQYYHQYYHQYHPQYFPQVSFWCWD